MELEPNNRMEELVKAYVRQRREKARVTFEMHPAGRRLLLAEVVRLEKEAQAPKAEPRSWLRFLPRIALATGAVAVAVSIIWLSLPRQETEAPIRMARQNRPESTTAARPPQAPSIPPAVIKPGLEDISNKLRSAQPKTESARTDSAESAVELPPSPAAPQLALRPARSAPRGLEEGLAPKPAPEPISNAPALASARPGMEALTSAPLAGLLLAGGRAEPAVRADSVPVQNQPNRDQLVQDNRTLAAVDQAIPQDAASNTGRPLASARNANRPETLPRSRASSPAMSRPASAPPTIASTSPSAPTPPAAVPAAPAASPAKTVPGTSTAISEPVAPTSPDTQLLARAKEETLPTASIPEMKAKAQTSLLAQAKDEAVPAGVPEMKAKALTTNSNFDASTMGRAFQAPAIVKEAPVGWTNQYLVPAQTQGPMRMLRTFRFERQGLKVRLVDAEGAVYSGEILTNVTSGTVAANRSGPGLGGRDVRSGDAFKQSFGYEPGEHVEMFHVRGNNKEGVPIEIEAALVPVLGLRRGAGAPALGSTGTVLRSSKPVEASPPASTASTGSSAPSLQIQGRIRLPGNQEVLIDATPER